MKNSCEFSGVALLCNRQERRGINFSTDQSGFFRLDLKRNGRLLMSNLTYSEISLIFVSFIFNFYNPGRADNSFKPGFCCLNLLLPGAVSFLTGSSLPSACYGSIQRGGAVERAETCVSRSPPGCSRTSPELHQFMLWFL